MSKAHLMFLGVLGAGCLAVVNPTEMQCVAEEPAKVDVFVGGEGYNIFRIPSLICTPKGTLLAFCEARQGNDQSPTDMVLKRSLDGGETWQPMQVLVKAVPEAAMDPTAVVERTTGKIILIYDRWPEMPEGKKLGEFKRAPGLGRDSITTWITTSEDDGLTWSEPRDITATTKKPEWTEACHGPGVGIQMRSGRIVIPCFENRSEEPGWGTCWNYALYSDDRGETWHISDNESGPGVNETQVVELTDGTLLLNMRSDDPKKGCRMGATSTDGGKTWSRPFEIPELPDPCCQASMLRYSWPDETGEKSRILYCGPGTTDGRHTGTVRLSYDESKTWPVARVICRDYFGYCCLTVLRDGTIGCLFEAEGCSKIVFTRFSLQWLTGEFSTPSSTAR